MITETMAKAEIASGLSAVCAWCTRYWEGREKHGMCGVPFCGGPAVGRAFPKYAGPRAGQIAMICFVCGAEADLGCEFHGQGIVGCCRKHEPKLREILARPSGRPVVVNERLVPVVNSVGTKAIQ